MSPFIALALTIGLLLVAASLFIRHQVAQNPTAQRLENQQRLVVWWFIFIICTVTFQLGLIAIGLLISGLYFWAVVELLTIQSQNPGRLMLLFLFTQPLLLGILVIYSPTISATFFGLGLISVFVLNFFAFKTSLSTLSFCTYFGFSLFSIMVIYQLVQQQSEDAAYILLVLFFVTSVNDIAQYISGSLFGKTLIAPALSPNKTVAGLCGGVIVTAVLCVLLLPIYFEVSTLNAAVLGSVIAIAGFLGDLLISKLKRERQVKNTGNTLSGHGGILDRVDSLLLITPVFGVMLQLGGHL